MCYSVRSRILLSCVVKIISHKFDWLTAEWDHADHNRNSASLISVARKQQVDCSRKLNWTTACHFTESLCPILRLGCRQDDQCGKSRGQKIRIAQRCPNGQTNGVQLQQTLWMDHLSLIQLLKFPVSTYLVVYGAHWTVSRRLKAGVQQAIPVGNSPQILPVAALLHNKRWRTSSKTARWQGFLGVSWLYTLLKIVVLSGSARKAYDNERN